MASPNEPRSLAPGPDMNAIALFLAALTAIASTHATAAERIPTPARPGWKLVWSDEFSTPGLPDPTRWTYETGFIRNGERQFYTTGRSENARVENGHLIIEARKERWANPKHRPDQPGTSREGRSNAAFADFTSASLTTQGKTSWTYGRLEVRAKLPTARGTWPAIWTLGTNMPAVGWPTCGEIDIMEFVGYDPGVVHANIHTKTYNHVQNTGKGSSIKVPDASATFHVYALEWTPAQLQFFVDDRPYFTYANDGTGRNAWPFDQAQYLILNLAIGGTWGGQKGVDEAAFPQRMEIDYVRIFEEDKPSVRSTTRH